MSEKWRHAGPGGNIGDRIFDGLTAGVLGTKECVQDSATGEYREVYVAFGQSVGDAIANGQFVGDDE